jgi:hypothetical protein
VRRQEQPERGWQVVGCERHMRQAIDEAKQFREIKIPFAICV